MMTKILSAFFLCLGMIAVAAQQKVPLALAINWEPDRVDDGWLLNIDKPAAVNLKDGQVFICKGIYKTSIADTVQKGMGHISFIHDNFIECRMLSRDVHSIPKKGDLCYFLIDNVYNRKDVFYKLARFAVSFIAVDSTVIFDAKNNLGGWNEVMTERLLKQFTADIKTTGTEMLKLNDSQQQIIKGGDFNGKALFTAMQEVKENEVLDFLKYVWGRPAKYAGHAWKISEVFATWMISGTPKLTGEIE